MSVLDWQVRRATPTDLTDIMTLERAAFPVDAWSEATMRDELASPHCYYLVAEQIGADSDEPAGIAGYAGLLAPAGAELADIQTLAVAASARRRGIGRALLLGLLGEAQQRSVAAVLLEVRADNPVAAQLYRRFGFRQISIRRGYYQPDNVDAHIMRRELEQGRPLLMGGDHAAE